MAKSETSVAEKPTVEALLQRVEELEAREKNHWKIVENFLARFGEYYNVEGIGAFFIVDKFVNSGVNGVALTPQQGLIEQFGLPIKTSKPERQTDRPCFVPLIIPELKPKEEIEEFSSETAVGDNSKAIG